MSSATTKFYRPARVGETYRAAWIIAKIYEKRGRHYHEITGTLFDGDGGRLLERTTHITYMSAKG
jgi:hypothetical protein